MGEHACFIKKPRTGEECKGKIRKLNIAIARYVGGTTDAWACTLHWTRIYRDSNKFCACPLKQCVATVLVSDGAPAAGNPQMSCSKMNKIIVLRKR